VQIKINFHEPKIVSRFKTFTAVNQYVLQVLFFDHRN